MKTLIIGNTGSGKSSMAERLIGVRDIPWLSLDEMAWGSSGEALPLDTALRQLHEFIGRYAHWVIEGCHGDLVEAALPHCTELRYMNPSCEDCISRCTERLRKSALRADGATIADQIILRVGKYDYGDDSFGRKRHRDLFESFCGPKKEYQFVL